MIFIHTLRHVCPPESGVPPLQALGMGLFGQVLDNNKTIGWGMPIPQGPQIGQYQFAVCPYCEEELPQNLAEWKAKPVQADAEDRSIGFRTPGGPRVGPAPLT